MSPRFLRLHPNSIVSKSHISGTGRHSYLCHTQFRAQRGFRTYTRPTKSRILHSAFGWPSIAVYIAVGASVGLTVGLIRGFATTQEASDSSASSSRELISDEMAVALPAGRPGTLTAEEEAKLRELWHLALQVFGVSEVAAPVPVTPNGKNQLSRTSSETSVGDKKKKSRLSFLKKKKEDPVEESPTRSSTSSPGGTGKCVPACNTDLY